MILRHVPQDTYNDQGMLDKFESDVVDEWTVDFAELNDWTIQMLIYMAQESIWNSRSIEQTRKREIQFMLGGRPAKTVKNKLHDFKKFYKYN